MKKLIIIVVSLVIIGIIGWFVYLWASNPSKPIAEVIQDALPFGSGEGINIPTTNDERPTTGEDSQKLPIKNLFVISEAPVAGAIPFIKNGVLVVRYVDRATGHITDADPANLEKVKIVNTTVPKVYEAHFHINGSQVLMRTLTGNVDVVENTSLALTPPTGTSTSDLYTIKATALRGAITDVAVSTSTNLFYVLKDNSSLSVSDFEGRGVRSLFSGAFYDWRLTAAGPRLLATTKASAGQLGYSYSVNTTSGGLTKILGPLEGLTAIPDASGNFIAYSYYEDREFKLFSKNLRTNSDSEILPATLAEKCIWSASQRGVLYCGTPIAGVGGDEPDSWYKGRTHFSDRIWRFDTESGIANVLVEPKADFAVDIDVSDLKLSPEEDYLIFTNKNDLSLWGLKLE